MTDALATEVLENVKRRMQGMWPRVYKVRAWVNETNRKGVVEHPHSYEEMCLTESAARRLYRKQLSELKSWESYGKYSGRCQLFIPHVFDDGSLAYWPDNEEYIERDEWGL